VETGEVASRKNALLPAREKSIAIVVTELSKILLGAA
jgi:hypothetical protein